MVLRQVAEGRAGTGNGAFCYCTHRLHPMGFSLKPNQVRFGIIHTFLVLMEFEMFLFFSGKRFKKNTKYSEKNPNEP